MMRAKFFLYKSNDNDTGHPVDRTRSHVVMMYLKDLTSCSKKKPMLRPTRTESNYITLMSNQKLPYSC